MEGSTVSDFSIQRILSPQFGHKPPMMDFSPDGYLYGLPGGFSLDYRNLRAPVPVSVPVPVPVPAPDCLHYRGMSCGDPFYPYGAGFHHSDYTSIHPDSGVYMRLNQDSADAHLGYHQPGLTGQAHPRQKARMRTVFTDCQTKQLEALFELTDYPAVEARAEVARSTGLNEETVRVWFKNRRARRKRHRSGSKVKSPSPPPSAAADKKLFSAFL